MKCPGCGFDSPDDALYCDLCKEPFRKTRPIPPAEMPDLDPGERIPEAPRWLRYAAWAFLAVWFVWGMIVAGIYLGRRKAAESAPPAPEPESAPAIP